MSFRRETLVAIEAVERALELTASELLSTITSKGGRDLVTATDIAVEDTVRGLLAESLDATVIGEERGGEVPESDAPYWLVDPITVSDESRTIMIEDGKSTGARREHAARFIAAAIRADRWDFRSLGSTLALRTWRPVASPRT